MAGTNQKKEGDESHSRSVRLVCNEISESIIRAVIIIGQTKEKPRDVWNVAATRCHEKLDNLPYLLDALSA
ncbi:MAG: hypothetical protein F4026_07350 [Synechococcus sp. SB0669_bin_8]|nr:hypothetical protein [Synechococcus sp. SB0663_bin_10]MYG47288.1 hypothetical protein [Synechococcus sp. SB0675_bin_6]MYJ60388.1 hypothetical protein [Synechococcus sp. SB0672_bin_6]MYK91940.1 hypothetical protein [Synechococcus sp. SB0669_bin_8]